MPGLKLFPGHAKLLRLFFSVVDGGCDGCHADGPHRCFPAPAHQHDTVVSEPLKWGHRVRPGHQKTEPGAPTHPLHAGPAQTPHRPNPECAQPAANAYEPGDPVPGTTVSTGYRVQPQCACAANANNRPPTHARG